MRFEVGNIVKISKKSQFYGDVFSNSNPSDTEGEITELTEVDYDSGFGISVRWDNGETNDYGEKDLGLVRR